ncbi:MAG: RDD family protein [Ruminococcus flavefaciens]|nr:RDD family protein [Ruminococcus flavefaciens]
MDIKKRSIAAVADVLLIRFMTIVTYCVTVSLSSALHNRVISITRKRYLWKTGVLILLYIAVMLCIHFLYFFLSEKAGASIGKKLAKYESAYGKAGNRQAARVALCKTGACVFYVVTVPYFLFAGKMPYDKVREKGAEDRAYAAAFDLPDKQEDHSMKELTIKRVIACIIDYALFCAVFGLAAAGVLAVTSSLWTENRNVAFAITLSMIGCGMVFLWGYFLVLARNPKLDLGKRIMKFAADAVPEKDEESHMENSGQTPSERTYPRKLLFIGIIIAFLGRLLVMSWMIWNSWIAEYAYYTTYCEDYYSAVWNMGKYPTYDQIIEASGEPDKTVREKYKDRDYLIYHEYDDGRLFVFSEHENASGAVVRELCRVELTNPEYRFGSEKIGVGTDKSTVEKAYRDSYQELHPYVYGESYCVEDGNYSVRFYFDENDIVYKMVVGKAEIMHGASGWKKVKKDETVIHIAEIAEKYAAMPYHAFREQTGKEAEFYHGDRFIGEIPDFPLYVIYAGEYDEDAATSVVSEDMMPIRIQGSISALLDGMKGEMSIAELADALSASDAAEASYELLEGGGTAYYVGNQYVQMTFDSDRNGEYDRVLLISLDGAEGERIGLKSDAWLEVLSE